MIWLPLFVGGASVAVALVALFVSHRATAIARESERLRVADDMSRRHEDARRELLQMARDEARLLQKWVRLTANYMPHFGPSALPDDKNPSLARVAAQTALEQSFVPGAGLIFRLTAEEMDRRFELAELEADGGARDVAYRQNVDRTLERIRGWALDPEGSVAGIEADLKTVQSIITEHASADA